MNNRKLLNRLTAALVFFYALVLYLATVAPTASFWDCGEFIAISNRLQVSHPPGAPFYMLLGRVFSMFVPQAYISLSINLMSVLASALTVLMTFLIILHLVEEWKGDSEEMSRSDHLSALAGSAIGALTFAATDSFWFNAVEAEVYALSMFFTAAVVWLIMQWAVHIRHERAGTRVAAGSGFGPVTSRYIVLIAYIFGLAIGIHLLNVLAIFFVALIIFFDMFDRPEWTAAQRWKGLLVTGIIASLSFFVIYPGVILWLPELALSLGSIWLLVGGVIALVATGLYYTQKNRMPLANLAMMSFTVILIGYSAYGLIFIRSAADPPIDENDPENLEAIVSYLKREQYGSTPLVPRRHSPMPNHQSVYARYDSDMDFFVDYQLNHMYLRYFMWNFSGRESDEQDAGWIIGFEERPVTYQEASPSEKAARNRYFALPLLLGLFGLYYHFKRDWRRAFSVATLFLVTGVGIILYLNQTPLQPRERDYSFVGSFFAFSLWIGIGATGILELSLNALRDAGERVRTVATVGLAAVLGFVPIWVATENYDDHDRSGRYVATEYAYNLLMSLEPNAILFTNGDNDTFPLWYLQEVEGVRQDVRVVCLSLLNTKWYIRQLRDQWSRDSAPLPISLTDGEISNIAVAPWQPQDIQIPVRLDAILQSSEVSFHVEDASAIESPMTWQLRGRRFNDQFNMLYVADQAALDIIITNARQNWERPVYFANTTSRDGQLNLQNYFQAEGLAYRIVPIRHDSGYQGRVVPEIAVERFKNFRFTNLNNPDVYFDENIRRMIDNYRLTYTHAAEQMITQGELDGARQLVDTLSEQMPFDVIPGDLFSLISVARVLETLGAQEPLLDVMRRAENVVLDQLGATRGDRGFQRLQQFISMIQLSYIRAGAFEDASAFTGKLADVTGDTSLQVSEQELRELYGSLMQDEDSVASEETPEASSN